MKKTTTTYRYYFGRFAGMISTSFENLDNEVRYHIDTYNAAMLMNDEEFFSAEMDARNRRLHKYVLAAYEVAKASRAVNSWRKMGLPIK